MELRALHGKWEGDRHPFRWALGTWPQQQAASLVRQGSAQADVPAENAGNGKGYKRTQGGGGGATVCQDWRPRRFVLETADVLRCTEGNFLLVATLWSEKHF